MNWKGLKSNSETSIQQAIRMMLIHLIKDPNDLKGGLKQITVLDKVGPAAASIFLSMKVPHLCCFIADEAIESLNPTGKLEYTPKVFLSVSDMACKVANTISPDWNAARVSKALWIAAKLSTNEGVKFIAEDNAITKHSSSSLGIEKGRESKRRKQKR